MCGMRNANMQKRLLTEADLTFKRALELAQGMEAAEKNAKTLRGTEVAVKQVSIPQRGRESSGTPQTPCYRCGRGKHNPRSCCFAEITCHNCGKKGHIAPVCRSGKKSASDYKPVRKSKPPPRTKYMTTLSDTEEPTAEEFQLFTVTSKAATRPITMELDINCKPVNMELDTGAAVSLISEQTWKALFPETKLEKSNVLLKTYTDEQKKMNGELPMEVCYGEQCEQLSFAVVYLEETGCSTFSLIVSPSKQ